MALHWLMTSKDLTEDQAITFITVMCDFQVTQVRGGGKEERKAWAVAALGVDDAAEGPLPTHSSPFPPSPLSPGC